MKKELYPFQYENMEFSKDGQLDELIALDRYAIQSYDNYRVGDTVVAIIDENMGTKKVGVIDGVLNENEFNVKDRFGELHTVRKELLQKPLETRPSQLWTRWAKGAASVEKLKDQAKWENEFRWLFDGFRYSLGGRIQLMLGQEFVTGKKANLTAYNCYVIKSPRAKDNARDQFQEVIEVAEYEGNIMRRGGGVGMNISLINTIKGSGRKPEFFNFVLPDTHRDYQELLDRTELGKFKGVTMLTAVPELAEGVKLITVGDSVEDLFQSMKDMADAAYDENVTKVVLDFSSVRHRNAIVVGVNGRSSGSVSWMELFVLIAQLSQQDTVDNVEFAEIFSQIVHLIIQGGSR